VVACNQSGIVDSEEKTPDWIEIFNYAEQDVYLNNYYLTDKPDELRKWRFPNVVLRRKSYLLIYASGENIQTPAEIHTNFKIDADGETLVLSNETSVLSEMYIPAIACDVSLGYLNNDTDSLVVFSQPTPGYPNYETGVEVPVLFSHDSGFYTDSFVLNLSTIKNAQIKYTLNTAEEPSIYSDVYTEPLIINNRKGADNNFSTIPNTDSINWQLPKGEIYKINIVRAAAFIDGIKVSPVYTKSYGVSPLAHQRYSFPVVSLVVEPDQLFAYAGGIYVLGFYYDLYDQPNFNYDWERDVFVEFFEPDGQKVISQNAQIEIAGQSTRWRRQKSLKLKASGKGNKNRFEYDFFNTNIEKHKNLILRTSFADYPKSFIKDELLNKLAEKTGLIDADCRPVIVFLNGEYWGIHILQEKPDKYYLQDRYGVDKDSIDLLKGNATRVFEIIEGTGTEYLQLRDYAVTHDLSKQPHFDYIAEHINIDNFINYYCFHMLVATRDWPWNNIKYWRPTNHSRKWEWIPFDFDSSYNYPETDGFYLASEPANETVEWSVALYNNLMANNAFKNQLIFRLEELLNDEFCTDSILTMVDEHKQYYEPEIEEHLHRWNFEEDYSWEDEIAVYKTFPQILAKTLKRITNNIFEYDMMVCDTLITGINTDYQENIIEFNIYPNPATSYLNIRYNGWQKNEPLEIIDISGKPILQITNPQKPKNTIDLSELPAGIYFIRASNKTKALLGRFIKLEE